MIINDTSKMNMFVLRFNRQEGDPARGAERERIILLDFNSRRAHWATVRPRNDVTTHASVTQQTTGRRSKEGAIITKTVDREHKSSL